MNDGPRAAVIYCRISLAALDDTTKTDEQERLCRELCKQRGWQVAAVFTDLSKSAWNRDRRRPGWDALLAGIRSGQFDAVATYWGDRLVRQPRDLEDLLDLREVRSIKFASIAGQYDFDNPDHRMMMRWEVARACNESDTISRRTKAGHARRRAAGLTRAGGRGGRAFGFSADGITHIPAEADVIREIAARILAGQGAGEICRDLNDRGLPTVTGARWHHGTISKMLARPRYAALMPDGTSPAAWQPVLDRTIWEQVRATLAARAKGYGYVTNERRYLLSGIARCGSCGKPLAIRHNTRANLTGYGCINPHCPVQVHRKQEYLDRYVTGFVCQILALPEFAASLDRSEKRPDVTAQILELERLRDQARLELEQLSDLPPNVIAAAAKGMAGYEQKITHLREAMVTEPGLRLARELGGVTREQFAGLPLAARRAVVSALVTVTVKPTGRRGPGFSADGIGITVKPRVS